MNELTEAPARLPWASRADHHCFGCSPANPSGLRLEFEHVRLEGDAVGLSAQFQLDHHYESYPGIVHGGILATVCDETMGNLVVLRLGVPALTTSMRMRYLGVISVGHRYRCVARAAETPAGLIATTAAVFDEHDAVMSTATASYRPHPQATGA